MRASLPTHVPVKEPLPTLHLVTVWNPSYAANAMEEHLRVLLDWVKRYEQRGAGDDDLYVWWGKVRSPNRQHPQAHTDEMRHLAASIANTTGETHLYLTDYQSLYVGDVSEILEGELPSSEWPHTPAYYRHNQLHCDFWFKLVDVRRLVTADLPGVISELKQLRNVHYGDRPVSLYGGMVDLPLFVARPDGQRFFDEHERDAWTDGRLWVEFDTDTTAGLGAMERELRENLFGASAWAGLEPATRTFIATAEHIFRTHRNDPAFDFGPVLGGFAKAMEVQCNVLLRSALRTAPSTARHAKVGDATIDVTAGQPLSLRQLARTIGGERDLNAALTTRLVHGAWYTGSLPAVLDAFAEVRNEGVHAAAIDRRTATLWRDRLVGVGCTGDFVELAKVRVR